MGQLGGYDRRFITGQAENDLIMRVYEAGGKVELCKEAIVYIEHNKAHNEDTKIRKWYKESRGLQYGTSIVIRAYPFHFDYYSLYTQASVGIGYAEGDGNRIKTGMSGLVEGGAGIIIPLQSNRSLLIGYSFKHISSLKPGDSGVNMHGVNVGIKW